MDLSHLKDHMVICGWKKEMALIIQEILVCNRNMKTDDLVILANIDSEEIDKFRQNDPSFLDLHILSGEYYNETMLKRANVHKATRIIILADETSGANSIEVDAKTLMTAINLGKLARNVSVCAELLDVNFDQHLKNARVDEIIYTNEYSKNLIANASGSLGLTKIFTNLLDVRHNDAIVTVSFPDEYIGKEYSVLRDYIHDTGGTLIGLLENSGQFFERKSEALREAQKNPNLQQVISNLRDVKTLEINNPHFNPASNYIIPEHSLAIQVVADEDA